MTAAILPLILMLAPAWARPAAAVSRQEPALDKEFSVRVGERINIEGERLRVEFKMVAEDSRCPKDVTCVWQGNAKVILKLTKVGRRPATLTLNTGLEPRHAAYRGYDVKLVRLEPARMKSRRIRRGEYVATLVVTRR